jgi:hypothetical protein|tara:strand:- start:47 stop:280 length:234 start_codon:yes stop_codon:yes gene_type:complete
MEILSKIGSWANKLTEIGISVIALGVVLEVLFGGVGIPFFGNMTVVDNIMALLGGLSAEGLLGLVGAFILMGILRKK